MNSDHLSEYGLNHLRELLEQSKERRRTFIGSVKTTRAEVAEIVLIAHIPALLREIEERRKPGRPAIYGRRNDG